MAPRWTRSAVVAGASLLGVAHAAVTVSMPSKGLQVLAGRTFTVEWAGTPDDSGVEIDLYHCGDNCNNSTDSCGDWVAALCNYGGANGCSQAPDAPGEYDVKMPEPHDPDMDTEESQYKVRVGSGQAGVAGCSEAFSLLPAEKAPQPGDVDGPFLEVISPMEGDGAVAGEDYTVEFAYDNGLGSSADRFKIDLYYADVGRGDCGKWLTSICDKPDIGCKDSTGDYDVTIPPGAAPGRYRIRVGRFADDSLYGCSGRFHVTRDDLDQPPSDNNNNGKPNPDVVDNGDGSGSDYYYEHPEEEDDEWALSMAFSYAFHDGDDPYYPGGGGRGGGGRGGGGRGGGGRGGGGRGGGGMSDDDGWWIATDDEDDRPGRGPGRGGGGLWGDDDDEEEREGERERESRRKSYSFSYEFVWTTGGEWYD